MATVKSVVDSKPILRKNIEKSNLKTIASVSPSLPREVEYLRDDFFAANAALQRGLKWHWYELEDYSDLRIHILAAFNHFMHYASR